MTKTKLTFVIASLFALVFLMGAVSALSFTDSVGTVTLSPTSNATFILTTDGAADYSPSTGAISLTDSSGNLVTLTVSALDSLTNRDNVSYKVEATGDVDLFKFPESNSSTLEFSAVNSTNSSLNDTKTITFKFENANYCGTCENKGNLNLVLEDITVIDGYGDDDNEWYLYDLIEVELQIENDGSWDIEDIEIKWELYNDAGKRIDKGSLDKIDLRDGDEETLYLEIKLDKNIDDLENSYANLYFRAKGVIDDSDSAYDENETCDSELKSVKIIDNDDFFVLGDVMINGQEVENRDFDGVINCDSNVLVSAEIVNIADGDEKDVFVRVYNSELGIDERFDFDKIKAFDSETVSFSFDLGKDIEEKFYSLEFSVYDDDNDLYETDEDDLSKFNVIFKVEGNCAISKPLVSAVLDSEAKAGKELVVKTLITNTEDETITFTLNAADYDSWASLEDISEKVLILGAGDSKEVVLTFNVNKKIEGTQTFSLELFEGSEFVLDQSISVDIEESKFDFFSFIKDNWLMLGLGVLILILIIAIIIVAVKASKR